MQHGASRLVAALAPFALLGGCMSGPDFARPAPPPPEQGYGAGGNRAAIADGPGPGWWSGFGSSQLDALVARAIASNQSLAASRATLEAAQQRVAAVAGRRLPQIDGNGQVDYQRVNLQAIGIGDLTTRRINPEFDLYSLGAGVSYDLDLFGRNRRALEQTTAQAEAIRRETEAAHLLIAGRVVMQVLEIAALNDRLETERLLIGEDERTLSLVRSRERAGAGTMVEVLSAQGQLASDRAGVPGLEQDLAEARAMLAVLLGVSPAELGPTPWSLDGFALPEAVPVALPSLLVRQRPDILEAEARLHAATAAIGVATADLYPNVTLGATVGQSTSFPGSFFSDRFTSFDIFAGLTAPIFHGGTLKANLRAAEAEARAAHATYRQTVLEAFGQVSGLLSALETDRATLAAREDTAQLAERSLHLSRRSFEVGNSGILQVLDASRSNQRARIDLLEARADRYQNVARLYAATAGGWISEPVETQQAPQAPATLPPAP